LFTGNSIEPDEIVEVNSKTKDDRTVSLADFANMSSKVRALLEIQASTKEPLGIMFRL
jgi:hypothetical protein